MNYDQAYQWLHGNRVEYSGCRAAAEAMKEALSASQAREAALREKLAEQTKEHVDYIHGIHMFTSELGIVGMPLSTAWKAQLRKLLEGSKVSEVRVKLCASCGFHQNCPTRNDDGGLCDDYVSQPKEPKQ